ncbi:hypothetical protein SPSIL_004850 [Sporomusa silvacetica DSM 10669]|uniref:Thoeris protein ThsB TIR-like domain-containing protein n=1 Tax=Sporomusa silvacetica DSM 10669 TaxID=1123289 RepID=A0ABZ3IG88_9FIRM|nr:TIR domain-containing protein [Sporomusa silvacetica]OZC13672.1 hypothetical protein SPSIL_51960 [Sporomusa silvacetica DSM 10669]
MKAFLIYSFSDKEKVERFMFDKFSKHKKLQIEKLQWKYNIFWKFCSERKINSADFIIFLVGEQSQKSENINWELKKAKEVEKTVYTIKLNENFELLNEPNLGQTIAEEELDAIINLELDSNKKKFKETLFNKNEPSKLINDIETRKLLLEEYKLLLQTSESLIIRRQAVNTFFLTANGVLISMLGLTAGVKIEDTYLYIYPCALALVGILLCTSWRSLLVSYGQLNTGKFAVLNKLEQYLPVSIFSAEWIALGEGKDKKKYKSFTQSETKVPLLFLLCYIIFFITIIIFKVNKVREIFKAYIS